MTRKNPNYSQHRWFGPGLTNARIIFIPEDRKQFAYLGPGVGSLAQPPGGAVGGDGEAAGVVAVLGGEDLPQDEGPLQEDEGDDAAIEAF